METAAAPPPAQPQRPQDRRRNGQLAWTFAAIAVIAAVVVGYHTTAAVLYSRSFARTESLAQRAQSASRAAAMEPWNAALQTRAIVMRKWLHGSILLSQGASRVAMLELADAYRLDVGDAELLALFRRSQAQLNYDTNRKAHLQHGHEGPGGTLRPQDLMR